MKRIKALTIFLAALVTVGSASAQNRAVQANIPFDFTVGNKLLPSGTYRVIVESPHTIEILNSKHRPEVLSVAFAADEKSKNNVLIFDRYGNQYFLSKILCSSADIGLQLPISKLEKKAQLQEASLRGNNQSLVAIKQEK